MEKLPPLPKSWHSYRMSSNRDFGASYADLYTVAQMQDYAIAAQQAPTNELHKDFCQRCCKVHASVDCAPTETSPAAFKNFHRALCERFDYAHDEKFWWRDQVSLIEHIDTKLKGTK